MPLYTGDELAETSHLTAEKFGAQMRLKIHQWAHGLLPTDEARLMRIAGVDSDRWSSVRNAIAPLFGGDAWMHERLSAQRHIQEESYRKRSEAGKKGGRPKKTSDETPVIEGRDRKEPIAPPPARSTNAKSNAFSDEKQCLSNQNQNQTPSGIVIDEDRKGLVLGQGTTPLPTFSSIEQLRAWVARLPVGFPGDHSEIARLIMKGKAKAWADIESMLLRTTSTEPFNDFD